MKLSNVLAAAAGLIGEAIAPIESSPDRVPHFIITGKRGVHRTKNSRKIISASGQIIGMAHGPGNVGEHDIVYGYRPDRSKYKPRIDTPTRSRVTA